MKVYARCLFYLIILIGLAGCQCSTTNHLVTPDISDHNISSDSNDSGHTLWDSWIATFDLEAMNVQIQSCRQPESHWNVTSIIPRPSIVINSYDPVSHVIDVDVKIKNPYPVNVYDVRLIIYADSADHKLVNADSWTPLFDIPGGLPINPFKAYARSEPEREFYCHSEFTENCRIYLPNGNSNVSFAIEASYPGNCAEPYEISGFTQGTLFDRSDSATNAEVMVNTWMNEANEVKLSCPSVIGSSLQSFSLVSSQKWGLELKNNMCAPAGDYNAYIMAKTVQSGPLYLYQQIQITVSETQFDPEIIGSITDLPQGLYWHVTIKDTIYAYASMVQKGILIFNISDLNNPVYLGGIAPPGGIGGTRDIEIKGNIALVALDEGGIRILLLDDPENPIWSEAIWKGDDVFVVKIQGDYVYTAGIKKDMFYILDISDPSIIDQKGSVKLESVPVDLAVYGNYAYVPDWEKGLKVIDISDPSAPCVVSALDFGGVTTTNVAYKNNVCYIAMFPNDLYAINVENPFEPEIINSLPGIGMGFIVIHGNYAYTSANPPDYIRIVNISDPENLKISADIYLPDINHVAVQNENLFAIGGSAFGYLKIFQLW